MHFAILLVLSLQVFSCGMGMASQAADTGGAKTIVITGITGYTGEIFGFIVDGHAIQENYIAWSYGKVSGNRVELPFFNMPAGNSAPWTGRGEYGLVLIFEHEPGTADNVWYLYTRGNSINPLTDVDNPPKHNISRATTSIAFDQFHKVPQVPGKIANNDAKTLVITGITGYTGVIYATFVSDIANATTSIVAYGGANVSNNGVTIQLGDRNNAPWTGSGEYYIMLIFEHGPGNADDVSYVYTRGGASPVRYNISGATTAIGFKQFRRL
jgi:hypothetical protein